MKKAFFLIFGLLISAVWNSNCEAAGLDEIYRDLVRSDNRGYLPLFVKNRQAPDLVGEEGLSKDLIRPVVIDEQAIKGLEDISLVNERQRLSAEREAAELRWQQALKNIQAGYVSSIELEELSKKEKESDPQAIDVLAWIYARGIGVEVDLIRSFNYYKKAIALGVPQAKENAIKVYKAMSPEEKSRLLDN